MARFTIFVDENVPDDVTEFLQSINYEVYLVRERFPAGTPDQVIANAASEARAVVVTYDSDYKRLAGWQPNSPPTRYPNMGVIMLSGLEAQGRQLITSALPEIEFLYDFVQTRGDKRLLVEVGPNGIFLKRTT
jgi:predicted nuclease of predicted toxin-antitoxin system